MFHLLGTLLAPDSPPYQTGRYEITVPPISAQVLGITKGLPLKATQVLSDPLADSRHRPIGDSAPGVLLCSLQRSVIRIRIENNGTPACTQPTTTSLTSPVSPHPSHSNNSPPRQEKRSFCGAARSKYCTVYSTCTYRR
jgi:hypothetical protein